MSYDLNKIAKLKVINDLAVKIQARLNTLETADAPIKSVAVVGNSLNFFNTTDTSTSAAFTINLPAEISLDAATTHLISEFTFNADLYVGATNPNLNGKPVLVLGVKTKSNDGQTTTLSYSFIDVSSLVDVYTASDTSIVISDNKIKANVSVDSDNMLATTANGLKVDLSHKLDKVASTAGDVVVFVADGAVSDTGLVSADVLTKKATATENNFVVFDINGNITDTGIAVATDAETTEMLDAIFGAAVAYISASVSSTSDFFSTDANTFHTFLQNAVNSNPYNNADTEVALKFEITGDSDSDWTDVDITYGDIYTLLNNESSTVQDFVDLLNNKIQSADNQVDITASYDSSKGLTFQNTVAAEDAKVYVDISVGTGNLGNTILSDLYTNADTDTQALFSEDGNGDYMLSLES